jgi:lipopolysaccharide export system permease protein
MIRILNRYIFLEFIKAFLGSIVFVVGVVEITRIMDDLPKLIKSHVLFYDILIYFLAWLPIIAGKYALPVSILFSTSYTIGNFIKTNELFVMLSGGISFFRIVMPMILFSFFISIGNIFFNEFIVVRAFDFQYRWWYKMLGVKLQNRCNKYNFFMKGKQNTFYYIGSYDCKKKEIKNLYVIRIYGKRVLFEIEAKKGIWDKNIQHWRLFDVMYRQFIRFAEDGKERVFVKQYSSIIARELFEKPRHFEKPIKKIDGMSYKEAEERIMIARFTGENYRKYLVLLHWRFAFPFVGFILAFIGSSIGAYLKKSVAILSLVLSLISAFVYYGIVAIGKAMGEAGLLPPILSAWFGNIIFAIIGILLFRYSSK